MKTAENHGNVNVNFCFACHEGRGRSRSVSKISEKTDLPTFQDIAKTKLINAKVAGGRIGSDREPGVKACLLKASWLKNVLVWNKTCLSPKTSLLIKYQHLRNEHCWNVRPREQKNVFCHNESVGGLIRMVFLLLLLLSCFYFSFLLLFKVKHMKDESVVFHSFCHLGFLEVFVLAGWVFCGFAVLFACLFCLLVF